MSVRRGQGGSEQPVRRAARSGLAIVVSRYNASITDALLDGALGACRQHAGQSIEPEIIDAPGAFELVSLAHAAAASGRFAGVLALGCIIKGETRHDEYLAHAVAHGLANVALLTEVPVSLGVLTVNSVSQARERAGGRKGNKGAEAMLALLASMAQVRQIRAGRAPLLLPVQGRDTYPDKGRTAPRPGRRG